MSGGVALVCCWLDAHVGRDVGYRQALAPVSHGVCVTVHMGAHTGDASSNTLLL
jgi:hypothetical protein